MEVMMAMSSDLKNPYFNILEDKEGVANKTVLFIGGLEYWTTEAQIAEQVKTYGEGSIEVWFFEDLFNGRSIGYCKVKFQDKAHAMACKEGMDGHVFNGKPCTVSFEPPESLLQQLQTMRQEWHSINPRRDTAEGLRPPVPPILPTQMFRNAECPAMEPHMNPPFPGRGEPRRFTSVIPPPFGNPMPRNSPYFQEMNYPMLPNAGAFGMIPPFPRYPCPPNVDPNFLWRGGMPGSWNGNRPPVFGGPMQGNVQFEAMNPRQARVRHRSRSRIGANYDHEHSRRREGYEMYEEGKRGLQRSAGYGHWHSSRRQGAEMSRDDRRRLRSRTSAEHDHGHSSRRQGHVEVSRDDGRRSKRSAEYDHGQSRRSQGVEMSRVDGRRSRSRTSAVHDRGHSSRSRDVELYGDDRRRSQTNAKHDHGQSRRSGRHSGVKSREGTSMHSDDEPLRRHSRRGAHNGHGHSKSRHSDEMSGENRTHSWRSVYNDHGNSRKRHRNHCDDKERDSRRDRCRGKESWII